MPVRAPLCNDGLRNEKRGAWRLNDDVTDVTVQLDGAKVRAGHMFALQACSFRIRIVR